MADYAIFKRLIEIEYSEIVEFSSVLQDKHRIYLRDNSVAEIWFSKKIVGRYSFIGKEQAITPRYSDMIIYRIRGGRVLQHFRNTFTMAYRIEL